jgi:hypothetical protein
MHPLVAVCTSPASQLLERAQMLALPRGVSRSGERGNGGVAGANWPALS